MTFVSAIELIKYGAGVGRRGDSCPCSGRQRPVSTKGRPHHLEIFAVYPARDNTTVFQVGVDLASVSMLNTMYCMLMTATFFIRWENTLQITIVARQR